jgi:hypothetical protein
MTELKLPLDFERLPEFWQLKEALLAERQKQPTVGGTSGLASISELSSRDKFCEGMAILLWLRLWVVLGYLARVTSRPGWLNELGVRQVNEAFWQFGDDCPPVEMLVRSTLLRRAEPRPDIEPRLGDSPAPAGEGYMCDLFGKTNEHLSGTYLSKEERGNRRSLAERSKNMIAAEAKQQGFLLPPETFRTRSGEVMDKTAVDRSMVLVITLDRCLKRGQRHTGTFTQGLVADADWVVRNTSQEHLTQFYKWLGERHDHPATPKSAEDVLRDWEATFRVARTMEGF